MLEARNRPVHCLLNVLRHRSAHALNIHAFARSRFRFDENLMPFLIPEAHDFGFYARAIPRPHARYRTVIHRCPVYIIDNDFVSFGVGVGKIARKLIRQLFVVQKTEGMYGFVAFLSFHFAKVDAAFFDSCRGAGFESSYLKSVFDQRFRQTFRVRETRRAAFGDFLAGYHAAIQINARSKNHGFCGVFLAVRKSDSSHFFVFGQKLGNLALHKRQIRLIFQRFEHYFLIKPFVFLSSQAVHRRSFCGVEHLYLQKRLVGRNAHFAAQSVHFPHEVAFRRASDCGIARHKAHFLQKKRCKQGFLPHSGRSERGFDAGVPRAYYDNVKIFHHFPTQNLSNIAFTTSSDDVLPVISPSACHAALTSTSMQSDGKAS